MHADWLSLMLGGLVALACATGIAFDASRFERRGLHLRNKRGPAIFLAFAIGPLVLIPWCVQTRGWRRGLWRGVLAVLIVFSVLAVLPIG